MSEIIALLQQLLPVELVAIAVAFIYLAWQFKNTSERFIALSQEQAKLAERQSNYISEKLDVLDKVVGALDKAVNTTDRTFDHQQKKIKALHEEIESLEANLKEARQERDGMQTEYQLTLRTLGLQSEQLKDLQEKQQSLEAATRHEVTAALALAQARAYHDLQLRLAAALALAENLAEDLRDGSPVDVRQAVDHVVGQITAASTVMHNLTHGEYLPKTYRYRTHYVRTFVDRAIALCVLEANKKGIEIRLDLQPDDGRVSIEASWRHLEQAFNNLIQNAVKYSYRSTAASTQRYVMVQGRVVNSGYEIVISNFGVGIEPSEYERIFEEGYRGRLTTEEYRTGSGLGLSMTKQIVEEHGGTIQVESEPLRGMQTGPTGPYHTRFTIWLPLTQANRLDETKESVP